MLCPALLAGCGDDAPPGKKASRRPPPALHAPGELRLTSAGQEPRFRLRYRWEPGAEHRYRSHVSLEHRTAQRQARLRATLYWIRRVEQGVQVGTPAKIRFELRQVRRVRPVVMADAVIRQLRALPSHFRADARGRVTTAAGETANAWAPAVGSAGLSRLTAPLPADAVGEGATWERREAVRVTMARLGRVAKLLVHTGYRLTIIQRRGVEREAVIDSTARIISGAAGEAKGAVRVTGKGTGMLRLELRRGIVTRATSKIALTMALERKGRRVSVEQASESSTRLLKNRRR